MNYLLSAVVLVFLTACSQVNTLAYADIQDLKELPQNAAPYTKVIDDNRSLYEIQSTFQTQYFTAWHMQISKSTTESLLWPFKTYTPQNCFGDNLQPISQNLLDKLQENTNFLKYGTIDAKAITTAQISLRALPTDKPFFNDPRKAGEGFPFDNLQESSIHFNEPLLVSHYSLDGAWAYVHTSYASGWVHRNAIVLLSEKQCQEFESAKKIALTMDDIALKDDKDQFVNYSKVGMQLPLLSETSINYFAYVIVADSDYNAVYKHILIPKNIATSNVLALNQNNINTLVNAIIHTHYGWGGMFGERDCSSTLKDLFTPFGIWLPRNSSYQAKVGKVISLEGLSNDDKIERIKRDGIPFQTLLHKKGHILLYAGLFNDKVVVLHNMWGIHTASGENNGRIIVGKTVFSTLEIGKEQKYYASGLLNKLDSMNILTAKP